MLFTLGQLAIEFPEVSDVLGQKLEEAELKMPPRPPSQLTGGRSRPGSVNNGKTTGSTVFVISKIFFSFLKSVIVYLMQNQLFDSCTLL